VPQPQITGDVRELLIERVGARGDGVAAGPTFVPLTLPGERVRASVTGDRAEFTEVLQASPERIAPPCPHFGDCGGCALQHWAPAPYLAWKAEQVRAALASVRIETDILPPFASPPHSRRRLALHARKLGDRTAVGFKARRSWRLVEIGACPIADPRLEALLPALADLATPFFEHPKSAPTLHVTLTETGLDVDVTGVERRARGLSADARMSVAVRAAAHDFARVTLAGEVLYQARQPVVRLGKAMVALPPGAFLQAVSAAEAAMAAFVAEAVGAAVQVADLYCGVGTLTFKLAETAAVRAIDQSAAAVKALASASGAVAGLKPITPEARDLVRRPLLAAEMKRLDAVVFDPPRAGAAEQAREIARSAVPLSIGVSCNPATFARDARTLVDGGFVLGTVLPIDQFLWSPHVELVGVFSR
jgi:23S rRNA (uracil1939-C5)-methyltransferase